MRDTGLETVAVHRAIQHPGCHQPVLSKARDEEPAPAQAGVWLCQWPKGAWSIRRAPTGAQPVVLTRLVLSEVLSMNTSLSSMLAMSGWRVSTHTLRRSATSWRNTGPQDFAGEQRFFYG